MLWLGTFLRSYWLQNFDEDAKMLKGYVLAGTIFRSFSPVPTVGEKGVWSAVLSPFASRPIKINTRCFVKQ